MKLLLEGGCSQACTKVRGDPADEGYLASGKIRASLLPAKAQPAPKFCATRTECAAQLITETGGTYELSITQGVLELASRGLREEPHRKPVAHHPVELEDVVLEEDVLEEDAKFTLVPHVFDDRVCDKAARRVHGEGDVPLVRYGPPHPLGHLLAQRRGVEPHEAEALDLGEDPLVGEIDSVHGSTVPEQGFGSLDTCHSLSL